MIVPLIKIAALGIALLAAAPVGRAEDPPVVRTPPPPKTPEQLEADRVIAQCYKDLQGMIDRDGASLPDLGNCGRQIENLCRTGRPTADILTCWQRELIATENCPSAIKACTGG